MYGENRIFTASPAIHGKGVSSICGGCNFYAIIGLAITPFVGYTSFTY
jgi:hypothetical protein